jgi:hypothetical protein
MVSIKASDSLQDSDVFDQPHASSGSRERIGYGSASPRLDANTERPYEYSGMSGPGTLFAGQVNSTAVRIHGPHAEDTQHAARGNARPDAGTSAERDAAGKHTVGEQLKGNIEIIAGKANRNPGMVDRSREHKVGTSR